MRVLEKRPLAVGSGRAVDAETTRSSARLLGLMRRSDVLLDLEPGAVPSASGLGAIVAATENGGEWGNRSSCCVHVPSCAFDRGERIRPSDSGDRAARGGRLDRSGPSAYAVPMTGLHRALSALQLSSPPLTPPPAPLDGPPRTLPPPTGAADPSSPRRLKRAFVSRVERAAAAAGLPVISPAARCGRSDDRAPSGGALGRPGGRARPDAPGDKSHALPETYEPPTWSLWMHWRPFLRGQPRRTPASFSGRGGAGADGRGGPGGRNHPHRVVGVPLRLLPENGLRAQSCGNSGGGRGRESAKPGRSQHQLGLAVDFGSISDGFAETAESRWLAANAYRFGCRSPFPRLRCGHGYRWEAGTTASSGRPPPRSSTGASGHQQYALEFLGAWGYPATAGPLLRRSAPPRRFRGVPAVQRAARREEVEVSTLERKSAAGRLTTRPGARRNAAAPAPAESA
jgi:hypothetical protein